MTSFPVPATKLANLRSAYWDNIKGVLIFLVVIAHFAMPYPGLQELVRACYSFHMPAFLFVSGYFSSRSSLQTRKMMRLICIFLLFNFILMVGKCGANPENWQWFSVHLSAWYLLALILYRMSIPLIDRIGVVKLMVISLTLGLCVGGISPKDSFCLYKIIPMYSFFIAGFAMRKQKEDWRVVISPNPVRKLGIGLSFAFILCITLVMMSRGYVSSNQIWWQPYLATEEVLSRVWLYFVGACAIYTLLKVIPQCPIPVITRWGRNSLVLYILHRPVVVLAGRLAPPESWGSAQLWYPAVLLILVLILGNVNGVVKATNACFDFVVNCFLKSDYSAFCYAGCVLLMIVCYAESFVRLLIRIC